MAKLPRYTAASPPRGSGQARVTDMQALTDTGEQEIHRAKRAKYAAIENLAQKGFDVGASFAAKEIRNKQHRHDIDTNIQFNNYRNEMDTEQESLIKELNETKVTNESDRDIIHNLLMVDLDKRSQIIYKKYQSQNNQDLTDAIDIDWPTRRKIYETMNYLTLQTGLDRYHIKNAEQLVINSIKQGDYEEAERMSSYFESKNLFRIGQGKALMDEWKTDTEARVIMAEKGLSEARKFVMDTNIHTDIKKKIVNDLEYESGKFKIQSEAIEAEISNDIIKGTSESYIGEDKLSIDKIKLKIMAQGNSGILDGTQTRVLTHFLDSQISHMGKEATQVEMGDATNSIYDAIDSGKTDEARKLWRENAWMFTAAKNDEINKDIREVKEKPADPMLTDALSKEASFTAEYKKLMASARNKDTPEGIAQLEIESMKRRELIRKAWKDKPNMTPGEKLETVRDILAPAKEEAVKKALSFWSLKGSEGYGLFYPNPLLAPKNEEKEIPQYKVGDKRTVKGVTYTYDGQYWTD